jgi:hypothetical protein
LIWRSRSTVPAGQFGRASIARGSLCRRCAVRAQLDRTRAAI